ncbi:MAG: NAD/NADP octopine/nopaline dehydrogenase family protein [Rhodoferax sp.]
MPYIELFGNRFVKRDDLLEIAPSSLNPPGHRVIALMNPSRIERWAQVENGAPAVDCLIGILDLERLAIAKALNMRARTSQEYAIYSLHVPPGSVSAMNPQMQRNGNSGFGPTTPESRQGQEGFFLGLEAAAQFRRINGSIAPDAWVSPSRIAPCIVARPNDH